MSRSHAVRQASDEKRMKPIPTLVKERLGVTALRSQLGHKIKLLAGQEILAVTVSGGESVAIVREDYLYELINLCNSLLYDRLDQEPSPAPTESERKQLMAEGKQTIKKRLDSK